MAQVLDSHSDFAASPGSAAPAGVSSAAASQEATSQGNAAAPVEPPPRFSRRSSYSRFVGVLKLLLLATAVGLIILVVAWQQIDGIGRIVDQPKIDLWQEGNEVSVLNPRWSGVDEENRPFTVTADLVSQSATDGNLYELELPKADLTLEDDTWLALTAKSGRFFYKEQELELVGDVDLFHDQGFEIRTEAATIDLKTKAAQGDSPVEGHGPAGRLNAEGFRLTHEGTRIVFTGKSRLIVYPDAEEAIR